MVCYLWFSNTLGAHKSSSPHRVRASTRRLLPSHSPSDPPLGLSDASTAALQFQPSPQFVHFMQKLLQTTQVSQSVIVLSLHYIYRLKEENHFTNGQAGSEFRVAVVALMMANKFVDEWVLFFWCLVFNNFGPAVIHIPTRRGPTCLVLS